MTDIWTKEKRSEVMSLIRSNNTKPEKVVRSMMHRMGFRFRLHHQDLPGRPDIVLPKYRAVIFVHGCFWHQHKGCRDGKIPQSNYDYWEPKLKGNARRDEENLAALENAGWNTLVIWECELKKSLPGVQERIRSFLVPFSCRKIG
jgi:DNA mismatch endonuclease (patch repair protein)